MCVIINVLIAALFHGCHTDEVCCRNLTCFNDNHPFDHLPLPNCPDANPPVFTLFTRKNKNNPEIIDRQNIGSNFEGSKRTMILVHGFNSDGTSSWLSETKNRLLDREDVNVIIIDWGYFAINLNYIQVVADTRTIGADIEKLVESLISRGGSSLSRLWCIGYSLGAHICGHTGKTQKFQRITGLDPAGPLFEKYDLESGLNPNRAEYVDCIHTSGKDGTIPFVQLGTMKALGHADFYPNEAGFQPGCDASALDDSGYDSCSHGRSHQLFAESIYGNCKFFAKQTCSGDPFNIPENCIPCSDNSCALMGFLSNPSSRGKFTLETNGVSPFCLA